jgi:G3E family GTPase
VIPVPEPLSRSRFLAWIETLPKEVERGKGYFRFAGGPELQEFQYAPPGRATVNSVTLLDEPKPAIVLIGRGYDVEALKSSLLSCTQEG